MARRSAQNPRYQRDSKVGSTRRSAASAKPKREAGESGGRGSSASKAKTKAKVPFEPDTPEFKRWRKIWLGLLVAAIVFSVGAWYARETPAGTMGLVFAYSTLFSALYIDFTKIRRMRKEWRESGGKKKVEKPAEKSAEKQSEMAEGSMSDVIKPSPTAGDRIKGMFGGKKGDE